MLQFILGRASSGKSYEICSRIAECVKNGGSPVLIIPEQFSFESEKRILSLLGDKDAQKVKVLSFSRLCDEVENAVGGTVNKINDCDKIILMNMAIRNVKSSLKCFGRYSSSSGFSKMMLSTVDEFVANAITPSDIYNAAQDIKDGIFARKLYDTATVFAEFNDLTVQKFPDFADRLTTLYNTLETYKHFENKSVFIDSFSGFTGQQYRIIDRILSQSDNTVISFCDNTEGKGKLGIFANIRKSKSRIIDLAKRHNIKIDQDTVLPNGKFVSSGLSAVEEYMCFGKTERNCENALTICRAQTAYDEAQFVARNIRRIVRENGAKFNDFVVIARNAQDYEQVLSTAFRKNGINCFFDKRLPLYSLPPASFAMAAMELARSITTEKVLRFHKSGVKYLDESELSDLENYVYIWNIDGNDWKNEWNMDPRGLENSNTETEKVEAEIARINLLRKKAIEPIIRFCNEFGGKTYDMAKAVCHLLESAKSSFNDISLRYKSGSNSALSDGIITAYSKVMKILDSLYNCLPEDITASEFKDAFKNCIGIETVGIIPQMIDEVVFGSAERIEPARPSYVFLMGANYGVFPRAPQTNGIFAVSEIGKLIELGLDIPDCSVYSAVDEDLLVYNCVCCADNEIYISFNERSGEMADFVKNLAENFSLKMQIEPDILNSNNLPETADDTFSRFCRSEHGSLDYQTLRSVLDEKPELKTKAESVYGNYNRPQFNIPPELSHKLTGNKIRLSPSKLDTYSRCPFMYFCKYMLSVKEIERVEFSALQSGTLLHYVLQRFIEESGEEITKLNNAQIDLLIESLVNDYLNSFKGYRQNETPHLKLMVDYMTDTLKYLGKRLKDEFSQSDFKPQKCELVIGEQGDIKPIDIPVNENISVSLTGVVDRLDRYGTYIRIIDYKSGKKEFKLPDILVGQNMQMLIYLYAVCKDSVEGGNPAGIFYMRAALPESNTAQGRRMNGFMPEETELITAMDKSGNGEFIPFSSPRAKKSGTTLDDFYDIFKFVEYKLKQTGNAISNGCFSAAPVDGRNSKACEYCDFASICRIENEEHKRAENYSKDYIIDEIKRQVSADEI